MSKRLTLSIRPEHALQYSAMLQALKEDTSHSFHPVFKAMFEDFHDMIHKAAMDQLTLDEIKKAARI